MRTKGFTLIELLVVISIVSLLSSVVLSSTNAARGKAQDARRMSDFRQIQNALELFYSTYNTYPSTNYNQSGVSAYALSEGVDTSLTNNGASTPPRFLNPLVTGGFLSSEIVDPINSGNFRYEYYFYQPSTAGNPCPGNSLYYLIAISTAQSGTSAHPRSPGVRCTNGSVFNWGGSYITGIAY